MSFIGGLGGFRNRLSKMYQDTKTLYDFTEPPKISVSEAPELSSLHRKLRIQKDRLIAWGLQWSDKSKVGPAGEKGVEDIDESLDKAGLGDVVGSVLATIKEIIAEADPLWQSSRAGMAGGGLGEEKGLSRVGSEKAVERKGSFVMWDRARFEGLIRELEVSIDTLYDISKNRQRPSRQVSEEKKGESELEDDLEKFTRSTAFESSRMQTPKQIDQSMLIFPATQEMPRERQIFYMRKRHTSNNPWKSDGGNPVVPVLLEYAAFDPIFADTGIAPPMDRFEKLFTCLQKNTSRRGFNVPNMVGYFEVPEGDRFGLIYELPKQFAPVDDVGFDANINVPEVSTLTRLVRSEYSPPLELRFRIAHSLAVTMFNLLVEGIVHGNVTSDNTIFFYNKTADSSSATEGIDYRQPFLTNFDLFSVDALEAKGSTHSGSKENASAKDLRSLAQLLVEIGLWISIKDAFSYPKRSPTNDESESIEPDFSSLLPKFHSRLGSQCGTLYMKAVQSCWEISKMEEIRSTDRVSALQREFFLKVSGPLRKCCAIDEDFETERSESDALLTRPSSAHPVTMSGQKIATGSSAATKSEKSREYLPKTASSTPNLRVSEKVGLHEFSPAPKMDIPTKAVTPTPKRKLRLFPTTNISQQHWDDWHSILMPRLNHLLRSFYRHHPESVEISLVSMGETPTKTKPTILAICTSVHQVKSILKKSFSYDKSTYDLKVCKGKILRSRKYRPVTRSMVDPLDIEEVPAMNTKFEVQPRFGASIGASIEGRNYPPVSLGGVLEIDGVVYGMSVHHMLDEDSDLSDTDPTNPHRSSGYTAGSDSEGAFYYSSSDAPYSSASESAIEYEYATSDEETPNASTEKLETPGDKEGIPVDCGDGYVVTQPAIDDIDDSFFTSLDARDEEHIDSHSLGEIYASSGIRRTTQNGILHEIDWALFSFQPSRLPSPTLSQPGCINYCPSLPPTSYPSGIVPVGEMGNLNVHSMGRSSGLRKGKVSAGLTSVKLYGRKSPSMSYEVADIGGEQGLRLGVPGDSGAWVVESGGGRVVGCVLAWSGRKGVAYICPMGVLIEDIRKTCEVQRIKLGNGVVVFEEQKASVSKTEEWEDSGIEEEMARIQDLSMMAGSDEDSEDADDEDEEGEDGEEEEDVEEDDEEYDAKTIKTSSPIQPQFKGSASASISQINAPATTTAPIRILGTHSSGNPRKRESELIPSIDKMGIRGTDGTGLRELGRMEKRLVIGGK